MKKYFFWFVLFFSVIIFLSSYAFSQKHGAFGKPQDVRPIWVTAYLPSWELNMGSGTTANYGNLPVTNIDWSAVSHIIMFACGPTATGTLSYGNLLPSRRRPFNDIAHSNNTPVLLALGGAGNEVWGDACSAANIDNFLRNVLTEMDVSQYDGIDLDIEPFRNTGTINDTTRVGPFIRRLYDSLQVRRQYVDPTKKPLLTSAILSGWAGEWWAKHEWMFDQINIMTYDMAQSMGWGVDRTWHNNAVFSPPPPTGTNLYYTSIQSRWIDQLYKRGGKNKSKYGVGIDFNGSLYKGGVTIANTNEGVSEPMQRWQTAPKFTWDYDFDLMFKTYLDTATSAVKRYDSVHQAAYLKIVVPPQYASDPTQPWLDETYLSYTNETQIKRIIQFVRDSSAGGVIVWNIGEGYLPSQYLERDRMLQAVKKAVGNILPPPPKSYPGIRGEIFFDRGQNGIKNIDDPMLPGWKVTSAGPEGQLEAFTDSAGHYEFDSLMTGEHSVTIGVKDFWRSTFPLPAGKITYTVSLPADTSIAVCDFGCYAINVVATKLTRGWDAVSLPAIVSDPRIKTVFPGVSSSAFSYKDYYLPEDSLEKGKGYLLKFLTYQTVWTAGSSIDSVAIPVTAGWNIIGSVSSPIPLNFVRTVPEAISLSPIYSFDNTGYGFTDSIFPGRGYWVKMSEGGTVYLSKLTNQVLKKYNHLNSFTDGLSSISIQTVTGESRTLYFSSENIPNRSNYESYYELPPPPKSIDFLDARFTSLVNKEWNGGLVGFFSDGAGTRIPLKMSGAGYPLNIKSRTNQQDYYQYEIETPDKMIFKLEDNASIEISKPVNYPDGASEEYWLIRKPLSPEDQQPKIFALNQNYPNPFNNGTVISFTLPTDGFVKLEVFNILGERVGIIADCEMIGGDHYFKFGEDQNLSSGLYLYKLTFTSQSFSSFTQTRRMLLLK